MLRKYASAGLALMLLLSSVGCGAETENKTENRLEIVTTTTAKKTTTAVTTTKSATKTNKETAQTTKAAATTVATTTAKTNAATTAKTTKKQSVQTTIKVVNNGSSNNQSNNNAVATNPVDNETQPKTTTVAVHTTAPVTTPEIMETEPIAPEDVEKYIYLSEGSCEGSGITISGNQILIQEAGTYHVSGDWYGGIVIQTTDEEKVKLRLEGAGIYAEGMPAIQVQNTDKLSITAVEGTNNVVQALGTDAQNDAAIYSRDDLTIKGNGKLSVICDNEHGIACNNDLEIENSILTVDAEKTGIFSHKTLTITGGTITAFGDNTGLRCKGAITIYDGTVIACGGKKATVERGGMISDTGEVYIEGGTVLAVGMNNTIPMGAQPAAHIYTEQTTPIPKATTISVCADGMELVRALSNKQSCSIICSSPSLAIGSVCDLYLNDIHCTTFDQTAHYTEYQYIP